MQDVKTMAFCLCAGSTCVIGILIVFDGLGGDTKEAVIVARFVLDCVYEDNVA